MCRTKPQLFSCLLIRGRGPEAHCALWAPVRTPSSILWLSPHSPWGGAKGRPKKDYTALFPFSQLHSVLMRFGQIFQDLFQRNSPKTDDDFPKQIGEYFEILDGWYFLELSKSFSAFFELGVNAIVRDLLGHDGQISRDGGRKSVGGCVSFPRVEGGAGVFFGAEYEKRAKSGATGPIVGGMCWKKFGQKKQTQIV